MFLLRASTLPMQAATTIALPSDEDGRQLVAGVIPVHDARVGQADNSQR